MSLDVCKQLWGFKQYKCSRHNIAKFVIFKLTQMEPCSSLAKDGPICVIPYSANNSVSVK